MEGVQVVGNSQETARDYERGVVREELLILASCSLRPMSRNSILGELSVRRFAVIQEEVRSRAL